MRSTENLPIEAGLPYHTIIGRRDPKLPLPQSSDGVVPYPSAHLDGALSEKVIVSGHSVQETPEAILELRGILRLDMEEEKRGAHGPVSTRRVGKTPRHRVAALSISATGRGVSVTIRTRSGNEIRPAQSSQSRRPYRP